MDELARIERTYGCVAEYQRCKYEEAYEEYEPTEEEILAQNISMAIYQEKRKLLSGEPSEFIKDLVQEWEMNAPKASDYEDNNRYIYATWDYNTERCLDIVFKLADNYNVHVDEEWSSFYGIPSGTFAVSVEYRKHSQIFEKRFGCLDYRTFKDVYRDIYYAGLHPSMCYVEMTDHKTILTGCSLGDLRMYTLKNLGFENTESLNKELVALGFDEEAIRAEVTEKFYM